MAKSAYQHIDGMDTYIKALRAMPDIMRGQIMGKALKAAAQPVKRAAKAYARMSERTGALRDSIDDKVTVYDSGRGVAIVGPDRAYYRTGKKIKSGGNYRGADRPANYAHLIEFGHHAVQPRQGTSRRKHNATVVGWVPAKPFMRPAMMTTTAEVGAAFNGTVVSEIDREYNRLIAGGKTA